MPNAAYGLILSLPIVHYDRRQELRHFNKNTRRN